MYLLHVGFLLGLFLDPEKRDVHSKRRLTFNGLHGVIPQEIEFFMANAIRPSNAINHHSLVFNNLYLKMKQFS
jgi:hypothetical protein